MPAWVGDVIMGLEALAFATTAIISVLTYRKAQETHKLTDSNRRTANDIVTKLAYVTGRQDVLVTVLGKGGKLDPEALLGEPGAPAPIDNGE